MTATALILAALSSGLLLVAGYLFGVRRSARESEALRRELAESQAKLGTLSQIEELLPAMRTAERIRQAMARLKSSPKEPAGLPAILDAIVEGGPFTSTYLTDNQGLLVASSTQARNTDQQAGLASLILTLGERMVAASQPALLAVLLRDESNQIGLHRIFRLPFSDERYILSALAKGTLAPPDALDPALASLEEVLAPRSDGA